MAGPLMIDLTKQVAERTRTVSAVKEEALKLVGGLPDEASWEDLIYQLYVRKKIERGIEAADQGRVLPHEEVKKQFLSE
jgi:predicted transcriptional regulator